MKKSHEEVVVSALPACDFDPKHGDAAYDGKTKAGPWGFMCEACFGTYGIGIGLGRGQRLKVA